MMGIVRAWNRYWFAPAPLFNLAVSRILIVATQIAFVWFLDPRQEYVDLSALPAAMYDPLPILHFLVAPVGWMFRPSLETTEVIRWIVLATGVTSFLGLFTNISLVVFAWGNIFLKAYAYSFGDFHHPEGLMMIGLVLLAMSPAGQALSMDDLRRRIRRSRSEGRFEHYSLIGDTSSFARWPLLSIQWLFAFAYASAAFYKLTVSGADWLNGYTLRWYMLQDAVRWDAPVGLWLGQQHGLSVVMSWFALFFEGTFFLVLIIPGLAWIYIPAGIGLHSGIWVAMRAPFIQWIALYSAFVSWRSPIKRIIHRRSGERRFKHLDLYFDGLCPLCIRSMTIVRYADLFDRLRFRDLEQSESRELLRAHPDLSIDDLRREMHVIAPDGSVSRGFFAFRTIARFLPTLWPIVPFFYLPFADRLGPHVYRRVAAGRLRIQGCEEGTCARHG